MIVRTVEQVSKPRPKSWGYQFSARERIKKRERRNMRLLLRQCVRQSTQRKDSEIIRQ
jgi:hypothetical protein